VVRTHSSHVRVTHRKCFVTELAHTTVGPAAVVAGDCWNVPMVFWGVSSRTEGSDPYAPRCTIEEQRPPSRTRNAGVVARMRGGISRAAG
jgi:hypothetical protein